MFLQQNQNQNQINLFKLGNVKSPKPKTHASNAQAFQFLGDGKTGVPGAKPLGAEKRTHNKLDPHDKAEFGNRTPGHIGGR